MARASDPIGGDYSPLYAGGRAGANWDDEYQMQGDEDEMQGDFREGRDHNWDDEYQMQGCVGGDEHSLEDFSASDLHAWEEDEMLLEAGDPAGHLFDVWDEYDDAEELQGDEDEMQGDEFGFNFTGAVSAIGNVAQTAAKYIPPVTAAVETGIQVANTAVTIANSGSPAQRQAVKQFVQGTQILAATGNPAAQRQKQLLVNAADYQKKLLAARRRLASAGAAYSGAQRGLFELKKKLTACNAKLRVAQAMQKKAAKAMKKAKATGDRKLAKKAKAAMAKAKKLQKQVAKLRASMGGKGSPKAGFLVSTKGRVARGQFFKVA